MSELTDFQILQLAATLAARGEKEAPQATVNRMFECATLIRIGLGDTGLEAAYKEEKAKKSAKTIETLEKISRSIG